MHLYSGLHKGSRKRNSGGHAPYCPPANLTTKQHWNKHIQRRSELRENQTMVGFGLFYPDNAFNRARARYTDRQAKCPALEI